MSDFPKLILRPDKEQSVLRKHQWIFSGAVKKVPRSVEEGDIVAVYSSTDVFLALGHYQWGGISVRIFSFENLEPDTAFWVSKIEKAWSLRRALFVGNESTNVFRLIHGEGDGMPGLIVDYYNGTLVYQAHSVGMYHSRDEIAQALLQVLDKNVVAIYDKSATTVPYKAELGAVNEFIYGEPTDGMVHENGMPFKIDFETGQKTGFFVDQRDNRAIVGGYAENKRVLNLFGYTGGFSVYAMQGGAELVHTVDLSEKAIQMANANVALNFDVDNRHKGIVADAFEYLTETEDEYDVIVLDPPSFAKHPKVKNQAIHGYKRLNKLGIEKVSSGGFVFTFSCSQAVSKEDFRRAVFSAAADSGRNVRILQQLSQPEDHPISIFHPESEYLKGLLLYVE